MTIRLFTVIERGLATLRTKAFRHVHDLPLLTQNTERRGVLVSRVTSDVDQVSQFLVFGGLIFMVSVGQMLVAHAADVVYVAAHAGRLAVLRAAVPLDPLVSKALGRLHHVRHQVGVLLGAISEPVVGAAVVRSYGVEDHPGAHRHRRPGQQDAYAAQTLHGHVDLLGGLPGLANAGVIVIVVRPARLHRLR